MLSNDVMPSFQIIELRLLSDQPLTVKSEAASIVTVFIFFLLPIFQFREHGRRTE